MKAVLLCVAALIGLSVASPAAAEDGLLLGRATTTTRVKTKHHTTAMHTATKSKPRPKKTTTTASPTATSGPSSNCESIPEADIEYEQFYSGKGNRTDPNTASGNDVPNSFPPVMTTLDGTLSTCDALTRCVGLAFNDPQEYYSIDLHYEISTSDWMCVQYYDQNSASDFYVQDDDVGAAYGYNSNA